MKPKKPFMIERGNDFARVSIDKTFARPIITAVRWVDWDGTQFATKAEAQALIDNDELGRFTGAAVIEILDQVRTTIRSAQ